MRDSIVIADVMQNRLYGKNECSGIVQSLAAYLRERRMDEIIVSAENGANLLFFYYAAMLAGTTIIPVDPEKTENELDEIRHIHSRANLLRQEEVNAVVNALKSRMTGDIDWKKVDLKKPYLVTYTSGSTGNPKGVVHSAGNLLQAARSFGNLMHYSEHIVMGHCMPMTYMAGILNTIVMPLLFGGSVVILPRFAISNAFFFWKTVQENGCNTLWLSPTMLRIVNMTDRSGEMKDYFKNSNMMIHVGTAPLDQSLREDFEKKYEIRLYQSYGLSETLFLSTEIPEETRSEHTVGRLLPEVDMRIAGDGELSVHVPWKYFRYTNEETEKYFKDECYLTGDLGRLLPSGNLVITGRKKELIVRGGYNINPRDIENVLLREKIVDECVVVPVLCHGEELIACGYTGNHELDPVETNFFLEETLGRHYQVDWFRKKDTIPKNLNGKPDKSTLRKEMEEAYLN